MKSLKNMIEEKREAMKKLQDAKAQQHALMQQQIANQMSQSSLGAYSNFLQNAGLQNVFQNSLAAQQWLQAAATPQFKPSKDYPNTLGWRTWVWDMTANELRSPMHGTAWNGTELRCETWDESAVIRGVAGIHAHLVPNNWHKLMVPEAPSGGRAYVMRYSDGLRACIAVHGLVERFGKYVLGTEGWRAEWVQIRKLAAPTEEIGLSLGAAFPDVEIVYGNR